MAAVNQILLKGSVEAGKIPGIIVTLQEKDMPFIHLPYSPCNFTVQPVDGIPVRLVEFIKVICMFAGGRACGRFIHNVISGHHAPVPVPIGKYLPERNDSFLEMAVFPQHDRPPLVIAVPVAVLPAGQGMHIQDYIDSFLLTGIQYTVQTFESFFLIHKRVHVILKMSVTQWNTNTICPCLPDESDVIPIQEIIQHCFKKQLSLARSQRFCHLPFHTALCSGIPVDEILHIHPSACAGSPKVDI